ncbi:MAG TPA: acyltransferase [Opitutaceae bacterium]|nr:acyltransferase [Opitutaceae bacterium]
MSDRVPGLDLLRAAAISLVVFQHQGLISGQELSTGDFGVNLFFVLSGFLIGGILFETGESLRSPRIVAGFWLRRWLRTLPNYYLFLGINVLVWLPFRRPHVVRQVVPPFLVFAQNFAHRPGWFFIESWSLCVEEWFYIFFPLALFLGVIFGFRFVRTYWATVLAMMLVSIGLRSTMRPPDDWGLDVDMVVAHKFDALGAGALAAAAMRAWPASWRRLRIPGILSGSVLVLECFLYQARHNMNVEYFARALYPTVLSLGWALFLPWASTCARMKGAWFDACVAAVARWSYSMYLVNFMASVLLVLYLKPTLGTGAPGVLVTEVAYFAVVLAASAALYRCFECPILRLRSRVRLCREAAAAQHAGS